MSIEQFLSEQKDAILKGWFDLVLDTYPPDTASFLKKQDNPFTNPVGHTIREGMGHILDELAGETPSGQIGAFLDNIIRIRAVQDLTPERALSFIFSLKEVVREALRAESRQPLPYDELLAFESRVDRLALTSFGIFVQCREKLYDIKANELRNMTFRLLQQVNNVDEDQGKKPDPAD
ncbi:MAG: RsbRD N-terminal domain-containing protein [Nitrospiraceae bacterium]|nr:RsbRD N-terminal domain-containing protein [Nitrospiraceae bacterium]